jgi:hypothetical protein
MAAWAKAVTVIRTAASVTGSTASGPAADRPGGVRDAELVHVLAGLVLGHLRPP